MSSGDSSCPCDICGFPGHWERDCPSLHKDCLETIKRLEGQVRQLTEQSECRWRALQGASDDLVIAEARIKRLTNG